MRNAYYLVNLKRQNVKVILWYEIFITENFKLQM